MNRQYTIKVTVLFESTFWVGLFERNDDEGYAVALTIFGGEPTDAELYHFVLNNFDQLRFTDPQNFQLIIKRKTPKRMKREVRREIKKSKSKESMPSTTQAQEALKIELEKNKKVKKTLSKAEKEAELKKIFQQKQAKKKKKQQGH